MFERDDDLGKRIRKIRTSLGDTLEEFGKRLDPVASHSLVSRWERNINKPNEKRLSEIARLGGVSYGYLTTGVKHWIDYNDEEKEVYDMLLKQAIEKSKKENAKALKLNLLNIIEKDLKKTDVDFMSAAIDFINTSNDLEKKYLTTLIVELNKYRNPNAFDNYFIGFDRTKKDELANELILLFEDLTHYRLGITKKLTFDISDGDSND